MRRAWEARRSRAGTYVAPNISFESRPLQSLGFACARRSVRGARPARSAVPARAARLSRIEGADKQSASRIQHSSFRTKVKRGEAPRKRRTRFRDAGVSSRVGTGFANRERDSQDDLALGVERMREDARRGRFLSIMMSHRIAHHIARHDALRREQERDDVRQTHHPLHHARRRVHRHKPPHARERERLNNGAQ